MPQKITVPRLGWSMEEGVFSQWLKAAGEFVRAGEMVFLLEGEKAAIEIESFDSGYLCVPADAPQPGATVKVGEVIGFLLAEGEPAPTSVGGTERSESFTRSQSPAISDKALPNLPAFTATPRARRRARELGVDWSCLTGSGRGGRIRERDIVGASTSTSKPSEDSLQEPLPTEPGQHAPATALRLAIAQRMAVGAHLAVPVTLTTKVDATALVAFRELLKSATSGDFIPSFNDILIHWTAQTLRQLPELNACWYRKGIFVYDAVHIATAVDTPSGLLAPVVRNADQLTLFEIAVQTRHLVALARDGQLTQDQLSGGTFTLSNLGMFGIDAFTPILNLPQAATLGIGRIVDEPVVRQGHLEVGKTLTLSLTFDHRLLDGAPAARWLQCLCQRIASGAAQDEFPSE